MTVDMRIWRVSLKDDAHQKILTPGKPQFLSIDFAAPGEPSVWVLVDAHDQRPVETDVFLVATGAPMPTDRAFEWCVFLGTLVTTGILGGRIVFHCFVGGDKA